MALHEIYCLKGDFLKVFLHLERAEVNEYTPWSLLLCGGMTDVPHVLFSSGPSLILEFHTDRKSSNSSGFLGHFRFVDRSKSLHRASCLSPGLGSWCPGQLSTPSHDA
ncbi:hypothetical protein RUM44_010342 [Polyplax serrata]|uniref:CUB domain-containing protein n=1 Tax=Polyplax serrata TaxID=468196 RepID=A0ABR1AV85_POLSC